MISLAAALFATSALPAQTTRPLNDAAGRIIFQLAERVDSAAGPLSLTISFWSENRFGDPPPLLASVARQENVFVLSDWRLVPQTWGLGTVGQASGSVALPINAGVFELVVRRSGIDDRYRVTLDPELIHVAPIGVPRVSVTGDTLIRRVIPHSLAVRCSDASWVCARVFREVALVPGLRPFTMPPTGRNPFGEAINRDDGGRREPARYFRYDAMWQVDSARSALKRIVDDLQGRGTWGSAGLILWLDQVSWERPFDPSRPPRER